MPKSETPNLDELTNHVKRLERLLLDQHPGLMTWRQQYEEAVSNVLAFFGATPWPVHAVLPVDVNDLLGKDVPLPQDPKEMPKPICGKCGGEIPFFYFYVYKLASTQGTMVFQASCCPHAGCRALFVVLPIGLEARDVATPGTAGWPGMPS